MKSFFWVITILGCVLGGFLVFSSFFNANGAPQQAALAAMAAAVTVIPYCFARAVKELSN